MGAPCDCPRSSYRILELSPRTLERLRSNVMGVPGYPKNRWFTMEKAIQKDDDWGYPLFLENWKPPCRGSNQPNSHDTRMYEVKPCFTSMVKKMINQDLNPYATSTSMSRASKPQQKWGEWRNGLKVWWTNDSYHQLIRWEQ